MLLMLLVEILVSFGSLRVFNFNARCRDYRQISAATAVVFDASGIVLRARCGCLSKCMNRADVLLLAQGSLFDILGESGLELMMEIVEKAPMLARVDVGDLLAIAEAHRGFGGGGGGGGGFGAEGLGFQGAAEDTTAR